MWIVYRKKDKKVVGMSADCDPPLEKAFALKEVVSGLVDKQPLSRYDAIDVTDPEQVHGLLIAPTEQLSVRETRGKLRVETESAKMSLLELASDAPDAHPVDGVPEIPADGSSYTTITIQKIDETGKARKGRDDNDVLFLRTDNGRLLSEDDEEISSVKLKKGKGVFRLVSDTAKRLATVQVFSANASLMDSAIRVEFV